MSLRLFSFAAAIMILMLVSLQVSSAQTSHDSSKDEAAIRQIVQQIQDGWNAHDGKAFAAPFAADADYVVVSGMKIKGREVIEKGHVSIFTTIYKESHNVATIKGIRFLRPDVAVVHVEWNLEVRPGGEKARAMNSMVLTKDGGKWSIVAFHNTPIQSEGPKNND